jgi:hypothetical protein
VDLNEGAEKLTGRAGRDGMILWIWREVKVGCEKAEWHCADWLVPCGFSRLPQRHPLSWRRTDNLKRFFLAGNLWTGETCENSLG